MLKRLLTCASLLLGPLGGFAFAANLPLLQGPSYSDPSQVLNTVDTVITSVNNGVTGITASLPVATATSGTAIVTILSSTLPTLGLGQTLHVHAWGVNDSNANARTVTFSFGGSTDAVVVTATSGKFDCNFYVTQQAAAVNVETGSCNVAGTMVAPTNNSWTVSNTAAIAVLVSGTAATAGIMTFGGIYEEVLR